MANSYFRFKQFTIHQHMAAMKVTTDGCLFGAWVAAMEKQLLDTTTLHHQPTLLDIGTGTGLLSLMIAQQCPHLVTAIDIEANAAAQAAENSAASPWATRLHVIQQDIKSWKPGQAFDCIVSNPPFYENELASAHEARNLAHHSSQLTLSDLVKTIDPLLQPAGRLYLLLPFKRWSQAQQLLHQSGWHLHHQLIARQTPAHPPFRVLLQAGKTAGTLTEEEIIIRDNEQQYSEKFSKLLASYYLKPGNEV